METKKIIITNEKLALFCTVGKHYLNTAPRSKLWFAVDKILKKALKLLAKLEEKKNEIRREFALKKDKGVFDTGEGGIFQFTEESHNKLVKKINDLDEETVEIPTHIIPDGQYDDDPKVLSFDTRNGFEGIVIPEIDYESMDIDSMEHTPKPKETPPTE